MQEAEIDLRSNELSEPPESSEDSIPEEPSQSQEVRPSPDREPVRPVFDEQELDDITEVVVQSNISRHMLRNATIE